MSTLDKERKNDETFPYLMPHIVSYQHKKIQ